MKIRPFIESLAKETGDILLDYSQKKNFTASKKIDNTLVTEADLAANDYITTKIKNKFPDDAILSEEGNTKYHSNAPATWVIDPLDGTNNFSLGLPVWGCSIARVVNGYPQAGAIYFPKINELYSAEAGNGAYLNNSKIKATNQTSEMLPIFLSCTRSMTKFLPPPPYKLRVLGAAAYDLCLIAKGGATAGMQATPKIWDIAAGWLILEESGGQVEVLSKIDAFPLKSQENYSSQTYHILMSATKQVTKDLKTIIPFLN